MIDWLKHRLVDLFKWLGDVWKDAFTALWDLTRDAFVWVIDTLLELVVGAVNMLDTSGFDTYVQSWQQLPEEISNILGVLGIGTASAIIVGAMGVRLVLQLIPFTRLGS